ncbi:DUF5996 family protein [Streptomyces sp. NPDC047725]|uniref:DUF5996 family protein n=1 Tax=Streptomyces sp. NPDC047725 TaxID=3365487 RepID=UPI0037191435
MELFPALPYASWTPTKETIHRFTQIVGKVRLAFSQRRNHWWNVPYHLTGRGITTRPMGLTDSGEFFCVDFDFVDHSLKIAHSRGECVTFPLQGLSVGAFHRRLVGSLRGLGVPCDIARPYPYDLPDSGRPFAQDTEHATYDATQAYTYWVVLSQVNLVLEQYAAQWSGKTSPVHHFWHTFDIAVTRFSDKRAELPASADEVTRESYSREVISAGFWFGDPTFPEPAFYSYTAPEPKGLEEERLSPPQASWVPLRGSHLAVLRYDDVRGGPAPRETVLAFLESAFRAGGRRAGWDLDAKACPGGVTCESAPSASDSLRS